jgi:hypothetical protein
MREPSIPIMGYVFVGITSVVLALVTVLDKGDVQQNMNSSESSTSMLPSIFSSSPSAEASPSMLSSLTTKQAGGKNHKTKSNKTSRLSKKSHKKND